jgi:two-component system cell cycle sensor histidine kinase PleC
VWQRIRLHNDADPRVLKAQLDVIADVGRQAWVVTPLWALALAFLCSDALGLFGRRPLGATLLFAAVVTAVSYASYAIYGHYRRIAAPDEAALRVWAARMVAVHIMISAVWGLMPWMLWWPDDIANHLFLLLAVSATLASLMISRASSKVMFVAGMIPIVTMTTLRYFLDGRAADAVLGLLVPLFALHLWADGRRFITRLEEDVRLRFNVEDLAAALRRARDEALKKRYEAETANASKTAFLANMSHELRTPLNAILGFSEIIANQAMGANQLPRYSEYARDIHDSGTHLLSLINDLLDVAKIEAGRMEIDPKPLDAELVVDNVERIMQSRLAAKRQLLTVEMAPGLPLVMADERAFRQMLLNLLSNAVKFTPVGGQIRITGRGDGEGLEICVADNGPGIAADKLARVFQPFSQIDNRYDREAGGTGLGLALVQGLAHLHGGRAWLESEEGAGVRAYLYFPSTMKRQRESATA